MKYLVEVTNAITEENLLGVEDLWTDKDCKEFYDDLIQTKKEKGSVSILELWDEPYEVVDYKISYPTEEETLLEVFVKPV